MQPQQAPQAPLIFAEAERPLGERLMKLALETDRVEGYTQPHAVMIARLAEALGRQMGLHGQDLTALKFAALAHDIGERGMKRNYLLQPNPLTWEETLDLWRHPILGEQVAAELHLPRQTQLLVRWHQEWWNGQGYPDGLAGLAIPLGARILRAVDTYCALISQRPHRPAYDLLDAEQMIADMAGIEFDPQIAKLLLTIVVAERKQREAEVWSVPPTYEPAVALDDVTAAEAEELVEARTPVYSPDDETLIDAVVNEAEPVSTEPPPPIVVPSEEFVEAEPPAAALSASMEQPAEEQKRAFSTESEPSPEPLVVPATAPLETVTAAPYGDVLMHQPSDEPPVSLTTDEPPPAAPASESDDQKQPSPQVTS